MAINPLQLMELQEIETIDREQKERFKIKSIDEANWAFRKLAALKAKEDEVRRLAAAERERIDRYEASEMAAIDRDREFFESLLAEYAMEQRKTDPKFRVKTPYGMVGFRKQQPEWKYVDDQVIEALESNGLDELIRVKKEPNKSEIKKRLQVVDGRVVDPESGAVIEGIEVIERPDKINISVEG